MRFTGSVMQGGRTVALGISINLRVHGARWRGELHMPKGATISSGSYELRLSDRRGGRITVSAVKGDSVYFDGDGPLKKQ